MLSYLTSELTSPAYQFCLMPTWVINKTSYQNYKAVHSIHMQWGFVLIPWVGICLRALERQTIIVSICNIACSVRSNPRGGL